MHVGSGRVTCEAKVANKALLAFLTLVAGLMMVDNTRPRLCAMAFTTPYSWCFTSSPLSINTSFFMHTLASPLNLLKVGSHIADLVSRPRPVLQNLEDGSGRARPVLLHGVLTRPCPVCVSRLSPVRLSPASQMMN